MSSERFAVWLKSVPSGKEETLYRVVRKNNRAKLDPEIHALLKRVQGGQELLVRAFEERAQADNLRKEIEIHGAEADLREIEESSESAA